MSKTENRVKIGDKVVKVALEPVYNYLNGNQDKQVSDLLSDSSFIALLIANRGGGTSSDENWLTVNDNKVGRLCAVLGVYYPHDNEDKTVSHFYKNGSYHIVIEKLKNLKVKAHRQQQQVQLQELENDMMEGVITPKEWKAQKDSVLSEFKFEISQDTKDHLISITNGYATKEALAEAMADDSINTNFTAIEDNVNAYLKSVEEVLFPTAEEPTEEEAEQEPTDEA